jgi:hypothetical protein
MFSRSNGVTKLASAAATSRSVSSAQALSSWRTS